MREWCYGTVGMCIAFKTDLHMHRTMDVVICQCLNGVYTVMTFYQYFCGQEWQ